MLMINSPSPSLIQKFIDGKEIEGFKFTVIKVQGLSVVVAVNGDQNVAKGIVKKVISDLPEMKYKVVSVMVTDDLGNVI